ncbi:MAG: bifunctional precorrin-2 dehydrogenase/sirohydrochlorin ferrochelatase [Saprospiraceae bacterium]|nr:bifunctional precorrin-2 dehydrogenase/sirohydrochlorin ferrochelatase [Saprospiraceae bacterium]
MSERNELYPVFLKLHQLKLLIVGAGEVGFEKLSFILKSSPRAKVRMVAPWVSPEIEALLASKEQHDVEIIRRPFEESDVEWPDLVIAATNIELLNQQVQKVAKEHQKLVNVADTPALCDFYLGSIVTKGFLKVAVSTNGQSPTFAKRFRQLLEEVLPEDTSDLLENLKEIRDRLGGDFAHKVKELNRITASLLEEENT